MVSDDNHLLLVDPAIRATGLVVLSLTDTGCVVWMDVVRTKRDTTAGRRIADNDMEAVMKITQTAEALYGAYNIVAMILEHSTGGAQSHRATRTLGIAETIFVTLAAVHKHSVLLCGEADVKRALLGRHDVAKDDIIQIVRKEFPEIDKDLDDIPAHLRSHLADALALYLTNHDWVSRQDKI